MDDIRYWGPWPENGKDWTYEASLIFTEIRKYFIEIEKMLYKYKDIIIKSLQNENLIYCIKLN